MKTKIFTPNAPEAIGPYSQAILSNETLYCSGQIALDKDGNLKNSNTLGAHEISFTLYMPTKSRSKSFNTISCPQF